MRKRLLTVSTIALMGCSADDAPPAEPSFGRTGVTQTDASRVEASTEGDAGLSNDATAAAEVALADVAYAPPGDVLTSADAISAIVDSGADVTAAPDASGELDAIADGGDCGIGPSGEALDLRCTGLYADWSSKTVSATARPYDPGLHLWSDGANKQRWIQLPPGTTIDTSNMDNWVFPVGTKIWKEFSTAKRIETRLLWKSDAGWYATTYRWSPDASSAPELTTGAPNADGNGFEIPAQLDCPGCHQGRRDYVLGFEAVSLSSPAASGMTLATLAADGLLSTPPTSPIRIPGTAVEQAALGYLHTNCGTSCHNPESPGNNRGFYMRLAIGQLGSVKTTDTWTTGWNVASFAFPGPAGTKTRIAACSLASSSVFYRMTRRDGVNDAGSQAQMPPIATHKVDDAGLGFIAAWIDEACPDGGR